MRGAISGEAAGAGPASPASARPGVAPLPAAPAAPASRAARVTPVRAARSERLLLATLAAGSILLLALAASVDPDPRGVGTHERLGLPPCGVYDLTGVPCPSCGMTTAFAHAVRLHALEALRAQPLGLLLCMGAFVTALAGPVLAARGTPVLVRIPSRVSSGAGWALLAAIAASWLYKVAVVKGVLSW